MGRSQEGEELAERLAHAENLPSPPTVAVEILRLTSDEKATLRELADALSRDPALAAKLLKLANSSLFRRGAPVTSLEQAAMRLGMKTVKLMALSFSLAGELPRRGGSDGFDYTAYWRRSVVAAVAGRTLARHLRAREQDEAFLCSLLGRLGQLVMVQCMPEEYARVLERHPGLPTAEVEQEVLGTDFHEIGAMLLRTWQLPETVCRAVRFWGDPNALPGDSDPSELRLVNLVHAAGWASEVLCGETKGLPLQQLHRLGTERFGLEAPAIDELLVGLEGEVSEIARAFDVEVDPESYRSIVDRARREILQLSLGAALDLEQAEGRARALEQQNQELETLATTDQLTGIPNRAHFDRALDRKVESRLAHPPGAALGILMVDVDHFKRFNDTYGHAVGDEVLKCVGDALSQVTRESDLAARYGGEEFAVIVENAGVEDLRRVAERIRARIEAVRLPHAGASLSVTASVGGAWIPRVRSRTDAETLLSVADVCLYEAKRSGRNRCVCRLAESTAAPSAA